MKTAKGNKKMIWIVVAVALIAIIAWGPLASRVEQAKYTVEKAEGNIELRRYEPAIIAETTVKGEREIAIKEGFRTIAGYIFGDNTASAKVAMTAPVTQQSEKIAMTAPVIQQASAEGEWKVRFVMPSSYTLKTLPKPNNTAVKLKTIPAHRFAVIRFSGTANEARIAKNMEALAEYVKVNKLRPRGSPTLAFYNPPWTLPFFRRNEVMVEIGG